MHDLSESAGLSLTIEWCFTTMRCRIDLDLAWMLDLGSFPLFQTSSGNKCAKVKEPNSMYSPTKIVKISWLIVVFVLVATGVRAVDPPPDGGYPNNNTA